MVIERRCGHKLAHKLNQSECRSSLNAFISSGEVGNEVSSSETLRVPFDFLVVSDMLGNETYHLKQNFLAQLIQKEFF